MSKFLSALLAGVFAVVTLTPVAFAQEKKEEKAEAKKTDGKKKAEEKKTDGKKKAEEKK